MPRRLVHRTIVRRVQPQSEPQPTDIKSAVASVAIECHACLRNIAVGQTYLYIEDFAQSANGTSQHLYPRIWCSVCRHEVEANGRRNKAYLQDPIEFDWRDPDQWRGCKADQDWDS